MIKYLGLMAFSFASLVSNLSFAQFAGDVFFENESVSVEQNGTVDLSLSVFSGATVFGAAHIEVTYDPTKLEVVSVLPGTNSETKDDFNYKIGVGKIGIVALNSKSSVQPIGTVNVAKIKVRSIAPVGAYSYLNTSAKSVLRHDSSSFTGAKGYSAEVLTTPGYQQLNQSMRLANSLIPAEQSGGNLEERAIQLRPKGSLVKLKVLQGSTVSEMIVKTGSNGSIETMEE